MDLFRLAAIPAIKRTNEARVRNDEARRLALSMAVITQVRVSVERYKLALVDQELAAESSRVDQRLASVSRAGSSNRLESELESLRTDSRALVSRFYLATAYAATQASYARVLNSVGIDLLPDSRDRHRPPDLGQGHRPEPDGRREGGVRADRRGADARPPGRRARAEPAARRERSRGARRGGAHRHAQRPADRAGR